MSITTVDDVKMIQFPQLGDERGSLVVIEGGKDIPFEIKRAFYMYGSDNDVIRGQHANRYTDFMLFNVKGTSKVKIVDAAGKSCVMHLDEPHYGVYIPHMLWKEMYDFSDDSVLFVLANTHYDGSEYIRDFNEYIRIVQNEQEHLRDIP